MRGRSPDVTESVPGWRPRQDAPALRPRREPAARGELTRTRSPRSEGGMEQAPGTTIGAVAPDSGGSAGAPARAGGSGQAALPPAASPPPAAARWRVAATAGRWPFQLILLLCYLAAGVAVTWPRASYVNGRLLGNRDQSSYVWDFWWIAHQVTHLGNPWFTAQLAAPAGTQLGFDTLMPLPGLLMTPVTLAFGPSASYNLLAIVIPGLTCYLAYR